MDEAELRERFEQWYEHARSTSPRASWFRFLGAAVRYRSDLGTSYAGEYVAMPLEMAWQAWQGAHQRQEVTQ